VDLPKENGHFSRCGKLHLGEIYDEEKKNLHHRIQG
jgi:hypothetical protein